MSIECNNNSFGENSPNKAGRIIKSTNNGIYKIINHSMIDNHSVEVDKNLIKIVPGVLLIESLFDYFGLNITKQKYEVKFNGFLKENDEIIFGFSQREFFVSNKEKDIITIKKVEEQEKIKFSRNSTIDKQRIENILITKNNGKLFQKGNFSFVDEVYSYHINKNKLSNNDLFLGYYNKYLTNPFLLLEFAAQSASLMASNFLEDKIITLKEIEFTVKNSPLDSFCPVSKGEVIKIDKKNAEIIFQVYQDTKKEKFILIEGKIKGSIIPKKLLERLAK